MLAEREKKEKRARRFDQEKAAFEQSEQEGIADYGNGAWPSSSSSAGPLAGRLGGVDVSTPVPLMRRWMNGGGGPTSMQPPMGGFQDSSSQTSWRAPAMSAGLGAGAGRRWGAGMQSAAFADAEVADPVSAVVMARRHVNELTSPVCAERH